MHVNYSQRVGPITENVTSRVFETARAMTALSRRIALSLVLILYLVQPLFAHSLRHAVGHTVLLEAETGSDVADGVMAPFSDTVWY